MGSNSSILTPRNFVGVESTVSKYSLVRLFDVLQPTHFYKASLFTKKKKPTTERSECFYKLSDLTDVIKKKWA